MKKPVNFKSSSGIETFIVQKESGSYALKNFYNNIRVDIAHYDLDKEYLEGLQKAIGEFLNEA